MSSPYFAISGLETPSNTSFQAFQFDKIPVAQQVGEAWGTFGEIFSPHSISRKLLFLMALPNHRLSIGEDGEGFDYRIQPCIKIIRKSPIFLFVNTNLKK